MTERKTVLSDGEVLEIMQPFFPVIVTGGRVLEAGRAVEAAVVERYEEYIQNLRTKLSMEWGHTAAAEAKFQRCFDAHQRAVERAERLAAALRELRAAQRYSPSLQASDEWFEKMRIAAENADAALAAARSTRDE